MTFLRKYGIGALKFLLVLSIFIFLFWRAFQNDAIDQLIYAPKIWFLLILGFVFNLTATVLTMIRWAWLVRALGVPFSCRSALRFGFIGYLFNLSPVGIVGGDVVKAYLLAKQERTLTNEDSRPPAGDFLAKNIASVVVDRIIGLYVMFLLGSASVGASGFWFLEQKSAKIAAISVWSLTILATIGLLILFSPDSGKSWRRRFLRKIPVVGNNLDVFLSVVQIYRDRRKTLVLSAAATLVVHLLFAASLFCVAKGLFRFAPSYWSHLVLYPVANIGSMIPLSAGPFEYFLDVLYPLLPIVGREPFRLGLGMIVGVGFRLATLFVAAIGAVYYFAGRNEISDALNEMNERSQEKNNAAGDLTVSQK